MFPFLLFDAKVFVQPHFWGYAIGGIVAFLGMLWGVLRVFFITRGEVFEDLQNKEMCNIISGDIKADLSEIKTDQKVIAQDIKELLKSHK